MKYCCLFLTFLLFLSCKRTVKTSDSTNFSIGIIADCQYCDCEVKWDRYYKKSPKRLANAVNELNKHKLAYTIHLGDFIDQEFKSFDSVSPIWEQLKSKSYHVLGNHDFEVADSLKALVPAKMNLKNRYYSFETSGWRFIVLDGNDLSFYGNTDSLKLQQTDSLFTLKENAEKKYAQTYNGGLSSKQLNWVEKELNSAVEKNQNVGFYCHFPANPIDNHNFWNVEEFLTLIENYPNVKVFLNGHNHAGSYIHKNGVHYITFKGMVDTQDSTSYALAHFTKDSLFITGFGREESRKLKIK